MSTLNIWYPVWFKNRSMLGYPTADCQCDIQQVYIYNRDTIFILLFNRLCVGYVGQAVGSPARQRRLITLPATANINDSSETGKNEFVFGSRTHSKSDPVGYQESLLQAVHATPSGQEQGQWRGGTEVSGNHRSVSRELIKFSLDTWKPF